MKLVAIWKEGTGKMVVAISIIEIYIMAAIIIYIWGIHSLNH